MAGQKSPFASMTQREQLQKWMEFQSIALPYAEGSVDNDCEQKPEAAKKADVKKEDARAEERRERPQPPARSPISTEEKAQRPRHRQYDAVIARMRMASQKAADFHAAGGG